MIKYFIYIGGASFLFCGAVYFNWVFSESLYFERNNLKYIFLVSSEIKEVPFFKKIKNETYYYSSGDGAAPGVLTVRYFSAHTDEDILQKYKIFFINKKKGVIKLESGKYVVRFAHEPDVYMFFIDNNEINIEYYW